jgi:hypothetical protein
MGMNVPTLLFATRCSLLYFEPLCGSDRNDIERNLEDTNQRLSCESRYFPV